MSLHHLVHSSEERIAKKIFVSQTLNNRKLKWYNELKMKVERMGLDLNMKEIKETKKSEWKKKIYL